MDKKKLLCLFAEFCVWTTITVFISVLWQAAELLMYGTIMPRTIDSVICVLLGFSVYKNLHLRFEG